MYKFFVFWLVSFMSKLSPIEQYVIDEVKRRRVQLGISQKELSFLLDVSEGYVGLVESAKTDDKYSLKRVNDLAVILQCSPKDLLPKDAFLE
ncbi:helix-turn-helix domain-containing protein [Dyadobacter subterraneus]|uniref:Helix-turn-helix domain-containing protein n=1 Tax=Dyadobacter subterraneus TaxID=2773304 RepID=A0ABR9WFQ8_9BACT|nr:helix-turn-helix domain-containing protein [Dyadobacter subterraneus]MBE9463756.1 helix-turn-helix domain-containing protein [Dyadobacter subterraneus]